jgi:DNA mismatch repair protein MSH5
MGIQINDTIDWEASENERRTCVRPHVDEELDQMKQIYHGLDNLLSKVALEVKRAVPEGWATELNVLYFPQLGMIARSLPITRS